MVKLNCQEKGGSNMARKGENIFYRKDGRWEARYFKEYDENHRIIYGYVYGKTYLEAKKKKSGISHFSFHLNSLHLQIGRFRY